MSQTYGLHNTSKPIEIISVNLDKSKLLMQEIIEIDNLHSDMQFHIENPSKINSIRKTFRMNEGLRTFVINPQGKLTIADPTEEELRKLFT